MKSSTVHLNNLQFLGLSVLCILICLEICSCLEITAPKYHHSIELSMVLAAELRVVILAASHQMDGHIHQGLKSLSRTVACSNGSQIVYFTFLLTLASISTSCCVGSDMWELAFTLQALDTPCPVRCFASSRFICLKKNREGKHRTND